MKLFVVATLLLASTCNASAYYGAVSTQYQSQDGLGGFSYGYAEPNSQKTETRAANGVTHGAYSYVDANGIVQSVKYTSDPVHGFQVAATNLPHGPAPVHAPATYIAAAPVAYAAYAHPIAHGAPIDTPEVQAAKAAHFAAHAAARANLHHVHKRSASWGYAAPWGYAAAPVIHNGVPVDTPEVQQAKAEHFAAHAKAGNPIAHYGYPAHNGAPIDTPEVQHAKAAHFAAHAAARAGHPVVPAAHYAAAPAIHNGVPVDTPEVQHAKAAHFAAVAKAQSSAGYNHGDWQEPAYAHGYAPATKYHGPIHIPVIHNGVPVETPEVQHAKAFHLAKLAEAGHSTGSHYGHYDDGQYRGEQYDDGSYHGPW